MSSTSRQKADSKGQRAGPGTKFLSRLVRRIIPPSGGGVDPEELRDLVETWRRKESEQGVAPYGSLDKARTYEECADELEEVIETAKGTDE